MKNLAFIVCAFSLTFSTNVYASPSLSDVVSSSYDGGHAATGSSYKKVSARSGGVGPRPAKWCGWWMRTQFGGGPEYNVARNWAKRGTSAGGPAVGAVVVWPHHVGIIVGRAENGRWLVKSGNDSNAVRTRARGLGGAIAFRYV